MSKIKLIALLLACAMCIPLLASCNNEPASAQRPDGSQSGTDDSGDFFSADYNKEDFTFLVIQHSETGKDYYGGPYIDADTYNGNKVNDAVYTRNLAVEDKYNVIVNQRKEFSGEPAQLLQQLYMAGDINFDAIYGWGYKLGACITDGYFTDINELGHTDLTKEYWSPSAMDDLTIDGKLYITMNDITMNMLEWAGFLYFNKTIAEDFKVTETYGDFYELVRTGKWTLDTYLKMLAFVNSDTDGDGTITKNDIYGIVVGGNSGSFALNSSNIYYTQKLEDGSYGLNIYSEKTVDIINKVTDVFSNTKYVKTYGEIWENADWSSYPDQWQYARSFFTTDHSLFCEGTASTTGEDAFRNMKSSYGIIPMPKYDEKQESYQARVTGLAALFAIPNTVRTDNMSTASFDRTGAILEYMAYKSNQLLLPEYYNTVLKGQRLENPDDQEMLDLIRSCVRYEFSEMIGVATIEETVEAMFEKPSRATSTYNRSAQKLQKALDDFYLKVALLESTAK